MGVTSTNRAAERRRAAHEARIEAAKSPRRRLWLMWSWLLAEARRDGDVEALTRRGLRVARRLNERGQR
jgi:hypothetical protein